MSPYCIFIVYGSLAPGRPNHAQIAHIEGTWRSGTIRGKLASEGWGSEIGYPGFLHSENPESIEVQILYSEELPRYWQQLDEFEGPEYTREVI